MEYGVIGKVEKNSMLRRMNNSGTGTKTVRLIIEEKEIVAFQGETVAAAMLVAGFAFTRITSVEEKRRAPYCMMGICFDCLVEPARFWFKRECV